MVMKYLNVTVIQLFSDEYEAFLYMNFGYKLLIGFW